MDAPERVAYVVVGAGCCGLQACSRLMKDGLDSFILLDKQQHIGGVWAPTSVANSSSRVQISEPSYRLIEENVQTEFTPQAELLDQMQELAERDGFADKIRCGATVTAARTVDAEGEETLDDDVAVAVLVTYTDAATGESRTVLASADVLFCTGGLQTPKQIELPEESAFSGDVILGTNSEVDDLPLEGRRVCVMGMGAFAVENTRTVLLAGAEHVTIIARKTTMVLPKLLLALQGIQGGSDQLFKTRAAREASADPERVKAGAERILRIVMTPYIEAGATDLMPGGLQASPPDIGAAIGSTIPTISDIFFLALALGKVTVVIGEVEACVEDGINVRTASNGFDIVGGFDASTSHVACDCVVKCYGFEHPDARLAEMVGRTHIYSPLYITPRILLMKVERNVSDGMRGNNNAADRGGFNIGGSVVTASDFYIEVWAFFRDHPSELPAALEHLPHVEIYKDSFLNFGAGAGYLGQLPGLQAPLDAIRARYARQAESQYSGGLGEFLKTNRQDWKDACKSLCGDEAAVPYMWDGFVQGMISKGLQERLPWPLGILAGGVAGLVPLSWLPMPGPPKKQQQQQAKL